MNKSEKRKKQWEERKSQNLCIYCGKVSPIDGKMGCGDCLEKKLKSTLKFSKNNKHKSRQYDLLLKHQVIEKYGGVCICCGENQILFLTIDHINNDGKMEREKIKNYTTKSFYLNLRKTDIRDDLQVLCFNCNIGKTINNGICPHIHINRILDPIYDNRHIPQFDTRLKIIWPIDEDLIKMCNESSASKVSKELGVSHSAVIQRLKRRNLHHLITRSGGISYGEDNKSSKLTNDQVMEIRKKSIDGINRASLSEEYNVSKSLIDKIITYRLWKHL